MDANEIALDRYLREQEKQEKLEAMLHERCKISIELIEEQYDIINEHINDLGMEDYMDTWEYIRDTIYTL